MIDRAALITPADVRRACRAGLLTEQTSGLAPGYAQGNLVILPESLAESFHLFCRRNPKPCPLLEVTAAGDPVPHEFAPDADLRSDLPAYRLWKDGTLVEKRHDVTDLWRDDFVAFLIGCSFTFEAALIEAGIPVRHVELGSNVPMYRTNIACEPAGPFHGPLVVSMRPLTAEDASRAAEITARYPDVHGAPIHQGEPAAIGIKDLSRPDFGEAVPIEDEELPVFWACGVTPQSAIMQAGPALAITHSPGCMFVTDVRNEALAVG